MNFMKCDAENKNILNRNKRRSFRINDEMELFYRQVSAEEKKNLILKIYDNEVYSACENNLSEQDSQTIDISDTGLAFFSMDEYKIETILKIQITLRPVFYEIPAFGKVVYVVRQNNGYRIGVEFIKILKSDKHALTRHIFHRQSEEIRQQLAEATAEK